MQYVEHDGSSDCSCDSLVIRAIRESSGLLGLLESSGLLGLLESSGLLGLLYDGRRHCSCDSRDESGQYERKSFG